MTRCIKLINKYTKNNVDYIVNENIFIIVNNRKNSNSAKLIFISKKYITDDDINITIDSVNLKSTFINNYINLYPKYIVNLSFIDFNIKEKDIIKTIVDEIINN